MLLTLSAASAAGPRGTAVAFFPDGKRLLAGSSAGYFDVLSVPDAKLIERVETGHKSVNDIAVSRDGARIVTANGDGTLTIWSAADFSQQLTLTGHTKFVMAVAFSRDGKRVASGGGDMSVRLWDAMTGASIFEGSGHSNRVNALAFSPDGKLLASASEDASVRIWDGQSGAEIFVLKPPDSNSGLRRISFSPDSRSLAAGNFFDTFVWDLETKALAYKTSGALRVISFSPDGLRLALGQDGIVLVNAETGKFQASFQPEPEQIGGNAAAIAVAPDWQWFAILPDRGTILIAKANEIDVKQAMEDCQYEEAREPLCLGAPCEQANLTFKDGCLKLLNKGERSMSAVIDMRCGEIAKFDVAAGEAKTIGRLTQCLQTRGDIKSIDVVYAKDGRGPPAGEAAATLAQCAWQVSDKRGPRNEARLLLPPASETQQNSATASLAVEHDSIRAARNPEEGRRVVLRVRQNPAGQAVSERRASVVIKVNGKVSKQFEISGDDQRDISDAFPGGWGGLAAVKTIEMSLKSDGEEALPLISCAPQDTFTALSRLGAGGRQAP